MMAMSYGYVYVAQIAMGANQAQTLKAIREAEAYPGPSVIIAYSPCIAHGLRAGMGKTQEQQNWLLKPVTGIITVTIPCLKKKARTRSSLIQKNRIGANSRIPQQRSSLHFIEEGFPHRSCRTL
jgi:pyruvate/2-oxoacid:ferredoxin oxidoreductase beta subunit